ncbi:hypothetical protein [Rhizobium sp. LjRoot254]|uniref:hypothetical protein n=1 Tax=Rhizobium sp. LjRoot254 TaxID=3342297 RepID=UPI003ED0C56D
MSVEMQVATLVIGGLVIWVVVSFYWLRVLACAGLLVVWGVVGVFVPIYLAAEAFQGGQIDKSLFTLLVCAVTGGLWYFAFNAARDWYRRMKRIGFSKKRWNAR